jgi:hypothetical protein
MFLQQNLHFPKFSSGVFVRAVGKICAPVGKLLFRSCSVTVAARCSVAPAAGDTWWTCQAATKRDCPAGETASSRLGRRAAWAETVGQCQFRGRTLPPVTGLSSRLTRSTPVVKARAGSGSNAASGNGDGQMCLAGVWPRRRDRFVSR